LYQIAKILVTPIILALEFCCYRRLPPPRLVLPLVGACAGVALATVNDVSVSTVGVLTAGASACVSATLKVLQQDVLQRRGGRSLELMRATWGPQTLLLLLCIPLLDPYPERLASYEWTPERAAILLLSALAGFALNVSSLIALKLTSAVALVLLSQGKTVATMLGGYLLFDAQPSARQLAGAALAVCSLGAYTYGSTVLAQPSAHASVGDSDGEQQPLAQPDPPAELEQQQPLRGDRKG
jgi:solute carrier family 35 protein E3